MDTFKYLNFVFVKYLFRMFSDSRDYTVPNCPPGVVEFLIFSGSVHL